MTHESFQQALFLFPEWLSTPPHWRALYLESRRNASEESEFSLPPAPFSKNILGNIVKILFAAFVIKSEENVVAYEILLTN